MPRPRIERLKRVFGDELRKLNSKVSRIMLQGERRYFELCDLRNVYDDWGGRCARCGLGLTETKNTLRAVHFTFAVPLEIRGPVATENLIPICRRCLELRRPRRPPSMPICGYNAFSDLFVQLAAAVYAHDRERVEYFKVQLDLALSSYIDALFYKPIGTPAKPELRLEGANCLSDLLVELTSKVEKLLHEAAAQKAYPIYRRD